MGLDEAETEPSYELALKHVHPDDRQRYENALKECIEVTGNYSLRNRIVHDDGSVRHVIAHGSLERDDDNQPLYMVGTLQDITAEHAETLRSRALEESAQSTLRRLNEDLQSERVFLENLVDTAQTIILVLDPAGRIELFNPHMEEVSGYTFEEVRGKSWFTTFLPASDREQIQTLFQDAVANMEVRGNVNPIVTKSGELRSIEWYSKTLTGTSGEVTGLLSVGQDITDRKRAESKLRESETRFRQMSEQIEDVFYVLEMPNETISYVSPHAMRFLADLLTSSALAGAH